LPVVRGGVHVSVAQLHGRLVEAAHLGRGLRQRGRLLVLGGGARTHGRNTPTAAVVTKHTLDAPVTHKHVHRLQHTNEDMYMSIGYNTLMRICTCP